jgi:hypothetical protein
LLAIFRPFWQKGLSPQGDTKQQLAKLAAYQQGYTPSPRLTARPSSPKGDAKKSRPITGQLFEKCLGKISAC